MIQNIHCNYIKYMVIILLFIIIFSVANITITVSSINSFFTGDTYDTQEIKNEMTALRNFLFIGMSSFLILTATLLFIVTETVKKKAYTENVQNDAEIQRMKKEIEQQNQMINELTKLYDSAVAYDTIKTEFFSNISHELKTPLAVILGAIQLMEQKKAIVSVERRSTGKQIQTIKQNSYRLLRLINNILDITRIDAGYIKTNFVNCNIVYLIEEITQSVVPYAEQKGLLLEFDTEIEEIYTACDVDKIERIILNLLSNAIKFTPCGGKITVTISEKNGSIRISVKDTGFGIPVNMQEIIFERFRQVNSSLTRDFEGSGIGLSLVKSFVELHNGKIKVNSEVGEGSEFIIELPVTHYERTSDKHVTENSSQNRVVDAINIEFSHIYSCAAGDRRWAIGSRENANAL